MNYFYLIAILSALMMLSCSETNDTTNDSVLSKEVKKITIPSNAIELESGLQYIVTKEGLGAFPTKGDSVVVHYHGFFMNGKKFDSSIDQNTPLSFRAGIGEMILGFDEAVMGMKVGEKRNLYIPYYLAYGSAGRGIIPPKSDLMFEVHLLEIKD